ncbi:efflux RND transporter permease subunit, partial [Acinetobacter baumannii]
FMLTLKTPVGTSITATDARFRQAEEYLARQPEVAEYYTTIGNYQGQDIVNVGQVYVTLKDQDQRKASQREVMERSRDGL